MVTEESSVVAACSNAGKIIERCGGFSDTVKLGTPLVAGASVKAKVLAHGKHDKVRIFKMRRRKHYQKRQGHRQLFTELEIGAIAA